MKSLKLGEHVMIGGLEYEVIYWSDNHWWLWAYQDAHTCLSMDCSCCKYHGALIADACRSQYFESLEELTNWIKERNKK